MYPELAMHSVFYKSIEMYKGLTLDLSLMNVVFSLMYIAMIFMCLLEKNKPLITTERTYFCRYLCTDCLA